MRPTILLTPPTNKNGDHPPNLACYENSPGKRLLQRTQASRGGSTHPVSWGRLIPSGYGSESGRGSRNCSNSLQSREGTKGTLIEFSTEPTETHTVYEGLNRGNVLL